jgi:hypothetical protein
MKVRCKKDLSIAGGLRVFNLGDDYHYHLLSAVSDIRNEEEGYFIEDRIFNKYSLTNPVYLGPYSLDTFNEHFINLNDLRDEKIDDILNETI